MLEELGFVQREAFLEIPPRVEYHLTTKGQELVSVIAALEQFGNKHLSGPVAAESIRPEHANLTSSFHASQTPVADL